MGHTSNSKGYQEMKYMLQLQDYNASKYKGLYVDAEQIEAVVPFVGIDMLMTNGVANSAQSKHTVLGTTIHMKSGWQWNVHNQLPDVLSMLDDYNEYMKGQAK